ncbi:DUF6704 family protein [Gryllotalpicola reticulitermitis]|uniref:DUF6704 family protein n=1 Tax=Gryllotalpicola reticulitermitis TaxID=1184153 RepID=A0ABV8Q8K2_9MICO
MSGISEHHEELGEGHSPAAWTAVIIMLLAFAIGTTFFVFALPWGVVASGVLFIIGLIVGWAMKRAGYGVGGAKYQPKGH